jgi:glucose/mannose-6-phosphate isomerase
MGIPAVIVPKSSAPRAALPQLFTAALHVVKKIYGIDVEVPTALEPVNEGVVQRLVEDFQRRPTVVAPESMRGVAFRVKNEFNENSKIDPSVEICRGSPQLDRGGRETRGGPREPPHTA